MANQDALIDKYLDQAGEPQAGAPKPSPQTSPQSRQRGRTAPVDIDALIDRHLDQQKSPDFTKPQPPAPSMWERATSGVAAAGKAVYREAIEPGVTRALEGGKQVADVILPPTPETRAVPARYAGTSDTARSRLERPGTWQDIKDIAAGGLKIVSSPLAPVGKGAERLVSEKNLTDDALRARRQEYVAAGADHLVESTDKLLAMPYDQRVALIKGQVGAAAETAVGALLPGAGIAPRLGEMIPALRAPISTLVRGAKAGVNVGRAGEEAAGAARPIAATGPLAPRLSPNGLIQRAEAELGPGATAEQIEARVNELTGVPGTTPTGAPTRPQYRPDLLTGKPTVRASVTPEGETLVRGATTRISTDPAPELSFKARALDEAGRPAAVPAAPPVPIAPGAERTMTADEFSRELFPPPARSGPLAPPRSPIVVPDVAPTSGVLDYLRDESGHLKLGPAIDAAEKSAKQFRRHLPQEEFVRRIRPNSPVITEFERFESGMANKMRETFSTPTSIESGVRSAIGKPKRATKWWDDVRAMTPDQLNRYEAEAVEAWATGGRTAEAYERAVSHWPQALQDYVRHRNAALQGEQAARRYLGLDPIPETPGPYLPRMTDAEARDIARASGYLGTESHGLQTTVKGFQHERKFATQLEGEANGIPYVDRRNAILQRELKSLQLRHTAQLIKNLEERGGIFRTQAAAAAASPTGHAFAVEGIPGARIWYTATEPERTFIVQNLAERGSSSLIHFQNVLLRNPNLVNPAPHAVKNMGAKYLLARGPQGVPGLARDVVEFSRGSNPKMLAEFKQFMPYSEAGQPAFSTIHSAAIKGPGGAAVKAVEDALGLLNKGSSKVIFQWADPAMRYSLYRYYRTVKGMAPQEAANNAWIDLVRYGTRSDITDFWKRVPLNMFVPWRVGTVTSLAKQLTNHPVRTALTIGAIDNLREMRYRQTGRWTHMPWDYVEGPIATVIEAGRKGDLAALTSTGIITAAFGPGGEFAAKNLEDWIHGMRTGQGVNNPDFKSLLKIFWGLSQIGDMGKEFAAFQRDGQTRHLVNIVTGALVGERGALEYQPKRLQAGLPQSLPGLQKDVRVRAAEQLQAERQAQREKRPNRHRGQTITERVGG